MELFVRADYEYPRVEVAIHASQYGKSFTMEWTCEMSVLYDLRVFRDPSSVAL